MRHYWFSEETRIVVRNRSELRAKFGTRSLTIVLTVDQRKIHRVLYRPPFGVSDSDGRPGTPERPGPEVAEQSASGKPPVPAAGRSIRGDVVRSKDGPEGDLTMHNRSMPDNAPLDALLLLVLALAILAAGLALLAYAIVF